MEILRDGQRSRRAGGAPRHRQGDCAPLALEKGFRPLAEEGIARVLDGSTSLAEVARAVDLTGALPLSSSALALEHRSRDVTRSHACLPIQSDRQDRAARRAAGSTRSTRSTSSCACGAWGSISSPSRSRAPGAALRRGRQDHAPRPDHLLLRHGADVALRHSAHRRPARPARRASTTRASAKCSPSMIEDMEGGKMLSQCLAAHPAGVRHRVREPGPRRRAGRAAAGGVREPGRDAQVAGRAGLADAPAADVSRARAGGRARRW